MAWRNRAFQGIKAFFLVLPPVLLSFFAGEFVLRRWFPIPDPYEMLRSEGLFLKKYIPSTNPPHLNLTLEAEDGLPGMSGKKVFSTNNLGFRGEELAIPKPTSEFRIFMIGASTTECIYLGNDEALPAVLQKTLRDQAKTTKQIKVYGSGKSGDCSFDNIAMLAHRVVHLEPDMVVIFGGGNDLFAGLKNYDYLHRDPTEYNYDYYRLAKKKQVGREEDFLLSFKKYISTTQWGRRVSYLLPKSRVEMEMQLPLRSNYRERARAMREGAVPAKSKPQPNLVSYKINLETLVGISKLHQLPLVFMTQPSSWNSTIDPKTVEWHNGLKHNDQLYSEAAMHEALEKVNDVMRSVSVENKILIYDLAKYIPKSLDYFYDDVHFNVKGAHFAGSELGKFLVQRISFGAKNQNI